MGRKCCFDFKVFGHECSFAPDRGRAWLMTSLREGHFGKGVGVLGCPDQDLAENGILEIRFFRATPLLRGGKWLLADGWEERADKPYPHTSEKISPSPARRLDSGKVMLGCR